MSGDCPWHYILEIFSIQKSQCWRGSGVVWQIQENQYCYCNWRNKQFSYDWCWWPFLFAWPIIIPAAGSGTGFIHYIQCAQCAHQFKNGQLGGRNILVKSLRLLPGLSSTQRGIACHLGTVFDGEYPSINKIAHTAKMNSATVKKAIKALNEKHIIDDSIYNWKYEKPFTF